jgi:PKD repeat protein
MKKIILLIFVVVLAINLKTNAQIIPCNADFTMQLTTNFPPHRFVPVVNLGMPNALHNWYFDDNTASIEVSPFHSFPQNGVYNVMHILTINPTNASMICRDTSYLTVTIGSPYECNLQAGFVSYTTPGAISLSKTFLNTSNGANYYNNGGIPTDSVIWNFGDGNSLVNFDGSHTYLNPGLYNVCVKVFKRRPNGTLIPGCFSEFCDTVRVLPSTSNPPCIIEADFISRRDTTTYATPNTINFTNTTQSSPSIQAFHWTFGDGTGTNYIQSPNHTYAAPGTYNVCLITVTQNNNCVDTFCKQVVVPNTSTSCNVNANFIRTNGTNPLTKIFTNTSTGAAVTDSIRWTFGDGTTANTYNATHTYANYGVYNTCLRIIKRNPNGVLLPNCVREFCRLDTIVAPTPTCNIQAFFTGGNDSTIAYAPYTIQFTNASQSSNPIVSFLWTFGDGTTAFTATPIHTFINPGIYTVCLKVRTADTACNSTFCKTIIIQSLPTACNLNASFTAGPALVTIPNTRNYTNTSVGAASTDSIRWTFGDGTSANTFNATHTYANFGIYNVCLRIIKRNPNGVLLPNCVRDTCITDTIQAPTPSCTLNANFTRNFSNTNPLLRTFTNTSTGALPTDSIRWTFGDGTSANTFNATHAYANYGIYNVCLRIIKRNPNGVLQLNCIRELCRFDTIVAPNSCNLQAFFTNTTTATAPNVIQFNNQSVNIQPGDSIIWNFGDSTANAINVLNPVHTYATSGSYWVCLRIVRPTPPGTPTCFAIFCKGIIVTIPNPCNSLVANFNKVQSTVNFRTINFFNTSTYSGSGAVSALWNFGDGTTSNSWSSIPHTYALPGTYYVCLRIQQGNCIKTKCDSVRVYPVTTINCNNVLLSYNYSSDSFYHNRKRFTAVSNSQILSQRWTITKLPITATSSSVILNQINPTYVFVDSGYYRVCLRATYANNCVKEYCSTIYIANNVPTTSSCNMQLFPNPAITNVSGIITLTQPQVLNAFIYNINNTLVAQKQQQGGVGINTVTVNISNLPTGFYIYRMYYGGQVCSATFMKQ